MFVAVVWAIMIPSIKCMYSIVTCVVCCVVVRNTREQSVFVSAVKLCCSIV